MLYRRYSLLSLLVLLLVLSSCQQKKKEQTVKIDQGFQEYVSAFTAGVVSSTDVIRIKLTSEYEQEVEAGTPVGNRVFTFKPAIKGKAYWVDGRTIDFKPNEPLVSGTKYTGSFLLSEILVVSQKFSSFPLDFQVIKQSFQVRFGELQPYSQTDKTSYKYTGEVVTADVMADEQVEDLLEAELEGQKLKIFWTHSVNNKEHEFVVENIKRKEDDSKFFLLWDGHQYGIDVADKKVVEIPGLNNFKMISAQVFHQPSQYVLLTFSDPLKLSQNLSGLITIKGESKLKYLIEENQVKIFVNGRINGERELFVHRSIKNNSGYLLKKSTSQKLAFEATKPEIRLIGKGVIIPESNGLIFPFEAVNLKAVDVRIIRIYEDNVAQFLQVNNLNGSSDLRRVGRLVAKKKIDLVADNLIDYGSWNAFSFDLSELIEQEPGAIYRVEISCRKSYSLYPCPEVEGIDGELDDENWDEEEDNEQSYWDGTSYYYENYYGSYNWRDRENPCANTYYRYRKVSRNVLASNLGIIAKAGNNKELKVIVTDLLTAQPLANIDVDVVNYQQRPIGTAKTDENGMATIPFEMKPYLLIAKHGKQRGYLKLSDGVSLSLSKFDVGGVKYEKGIKGFIYGERGVWRPGDTIFMTFILEDKDKLLPAEHPVSFELVNPHGKVVKRMIKSSGVGGFYHFETSTKDDDPTGNWLARVKVGGATFVKQVKVETIKPNRLKINLDFGKDIIRKDDKSLFGAMEVKWLHGAIAKNLQAEVMMELKPIKTRFKVFNDYIFDDPSVNFDKIEKKVFDAKISEEGKAQVNPKLEILSQSPGMLMASFNTKVFEEGGNFSVNSKSIPYAPYDYFVGVKVPKGDKRRGMLLTDEKHKIEVVTVDAEGEKVSVSGLVGKVYKVEWRWWWQSGSDNIGNYIKRRNLQPILKRKFSTTDGFGSFDIEVKYPDWGRYIIKVESPGGHSTGKTVYIDWPGWAGRAQDENSGGASMLSFSADKEKYSVGEDISVSIPSSEGGRALVSVEKGSRVVDAFWVDTQKEQTNFTFKASEEMSPNVFINVTMLQPHGQTKNDLPIRMYGVIPILVEDPTTKLQPVITMSDELKPESDVSIKISEKNNQAMTFTVAVVDEGLLDLTNYKTPNPWTSFYAREALSVRTWDLYDYVLGAYGAKIEACFAIGGDGDLDKNKGRKARRFKPVVEFFGPYQLEKGETRDFNFTMPRYIGAVKTMVIAGNDKAYGAISKSVPVKNPLMLFATLPRVLSPEETVKLPITLFALDDDIRDVKVEVKCNDLLQVVGEKTQVLKFEKAGEMDFDFELKSSGLMGYAKVEVVATSGNERATYEIEMDVRAPNPPRVKTYSTVVSPGETWEQSFDVFGIEKTNSAVLEVSGMPSINLTRRLRYLIRYPYGCVEQTTSSVFPQLYLGEVTKLDKKLQNRMKNNVNKGLERLSSFQLSNGGFAYWPGNSTVNEWGTNYAGHFIIEAEEQGYSLPIGMKSSWLSYQTSKANNWKLKTSRYSTNGFTQAYRLYTLALAGHSNLAAMNRLKESSALSTQAAYYLSMAYMHSGNKEAAMSIIQGLERNATSMRVYGYTYGSVDRNSALILEGLLTAEMYDEAMPLIKSISDKLNAENWMSTQTTAFCLKAMCKAAKVFKEGNSSFEYEYALNGSELTKVSSTDLVNQYDMVLDDKQVSNVLTLENKSKTPFYVNLAVEGTPLVDGFDKEEKNLSLDVVYKNLEGTVIDPASIDQGTDFKVEVSVKNLGPVQHCENLALSMMFPSGWEINNTRLYGGGSVHAKSVPDYQDIRDDRVNTFFDLKLHETKTFVILLNASYQGEYSMPAIQCSAMYNNDIRARIPGQKVKVVKSSK